MIYKIEDKKECYLEKLKDINRNADSQKLSKTLFVGSTKIDESHQVYKELENDAVEFCNGFSILLLEEEPPFFKQGLPLTRKRRQVKDGTKLSKYKGQTQTQFIAFNKANSKENTGLAEAVAEADRSQARVSGSAGMGQAQSQSGSGDTCEECFLHRGIGWHTTEQGKTIPTTSFSGSVQPAYYPISGSQNYTPATIRSGDTAVQPSETGQQTYIPIPQVHQRYPQGPQTQRSGVDQISVGQQMGLPQPAYVQTTQQITPQLQGSTQTIPLPQSHLQQIPQQYPGGLQPIPSQHTYTPYIYPRYTPQTTQQYVPQLTPSHQLQQGSTHPTSLSAGPILGNNSYLTTPYNHQPIQPSVFISEKLPITSSSSESPLGLKISKSCIPGQNCIPTQIFQQVYINSGETGSSAYTGRSEESGKHVASSEQGCYGLSCQPTQTYQTAHISPMSTIYHTFPIQQALTCTQGQICTTDTKQFPAEQVQPGKSTPTYSTSYLPISQIYPKEQTSTPLQFSLQSGQLPLSTRFPPSSAFIQPGTSQIIPGISYQPGSGQLFSSIQLPTGAQSQHGATQLPTGPYYQGVQFLNGSKFQPIGSQIIQETGSRQLLPEGGLSGEVQLQSGTHIQPGSSQITPGIQYQPGSGQLPMITQPQPGVPSGTQILLGSDQITPGIQYQPGSGQLPIITQPQPGVPSGTQIQPGSSQITPGIQYQLGSRQLPMITQPQPGVPSGTQIQPGSSQITPGIQYQPGSGQLPIITQPQPGEPSATQIQPGSSQITPGIQYQLGSGQITPVTQYQPGSGLLPGIAQSQPGIQVQSGTQIYPGSSQITPVTQYQPGSGQLPIITQPQPGVQLQSGTQIQHASGQSLPVSELLPTGTQLLPEHGYVIPRTMYYPQSAQVPTGTQIQSGQPQFQPQTQSSQQIGSAQIPTGIQLQSGGGYITPEAQYRQLLLGGQGPVQPEWPAGTSSGDYQATGGKGPDISQGTYLTHIDAESGEAQSLGSIKIEGNDTTASASSQGKTRNGVAQAQVSGTYTGSFSAQAQTGDGEKGAESQIFGNSTGAISSSQGKAGKSSAQSQIKYNYDNGGTSAESQSSGINYSTNTQIQAGVGGGLADAQSTGSGSTSSQAQIGFLPHNETKERQKSFFNGGGSTSSQSGGISGQSQTQLQGSFLHGASYTGAAQSSAGRSIQNTTKLSFNSSFLQSINKLNLKSGENNITQTNHKENDVTKITPQPSNLDYLKPTTTTSTTHSAIYESGVVKTTVPLQTVSPDKDNDNSTNDDDDVDLNNDNNNLVFDDDLVSTETSNLNGKERKRAKDEKVYNKFGQNQEAFIKSNKHDAFIVRDSTSKGTDVLQPGELVPGSDHFTIPAGFRGRITSTAGERTKASAVPGGQSQSQTVILKPGTGKVTYMENPTYSDSDQYRIQNDAINSKQKESRHVYPMKNPYDTYVSVTKSETGELNNGDKKYSHTYYTKSSTCGYFTFSCNIIQGLGGRTKICKPNPPTYSDGTPC